MSGYRYQPFYCEENIWHLSGRPELRERARFVVFLAAARAEAFVIFDQCAAQPGQPTCWDYHVLLLAQSELEGWEIWDLDSRQPPPLPVAQYLHRSFHGIARFADSSWPVFRLHEVTEFRREFRSDRSHMKDARGDWLEPPPRWPTIGGAGSNLQSFRQERGERLELDAFRARFC